MPLRRPDWIPLRRIAKTLISVRTINQRESVWLLSNVQQTRVYLGFHLRSADRGHVLCCLFVTSEAEFLFLLVTDFLEVISFGRDRKGSFFADAHLRDLGKLQTQIFLIIQN